MEENVDELQNSNEDQNADEDQTHDEASDDQDKDYEPSSSDLRQLLDDEKNNDSIQPVSTLTFPVCVFFLIFCCIFSGAKTR